VKEEKPDIVKTEPDVKPNVSVEGELRDWLLTGQTQILSF